MNEVAKKKRHTTKLIYNSILISVAVLEVLCVILGIALKDKEVASIFNIIGMILFIVFIITSTFFTIKLKSNENNELVIINNMIAENKFEEAKEYLLKWEAKNYYDIGDYRESIILYTIAYCDLMLNNVDEAYSYLEQIKIEEQVKNLNNNDCYLVYDVMTLFYLSSINKYKHNDELSKHYYDFYLSEKEHFNELIKHNDKVINKLKEIDLLFELVINEKEIDITKVINNQSFKMEFMKELLNLGK